MGKRRIKIFLFPTITTTTIFLLFLILQSYALAPSETTTPTINNNIELLDVKRLKHEIANGRVYQHHNFINEEQVQAMIDDIEKLREQNKMQPSGLSNTLKKENQNFGDEDRTTAPAPWWNQSLLDAAADGTTVPKNENGNDQTCSGDGGVVGDTIQSVIDKIQKLRLETSSSLNRPTMSDATLAHECYYSRSTAGAYLPRHMDERHEEFKGPRGWMLPSRRSISWLIYLSDVDLVGGQLRTFPQRNYNCGKPGILECGSHNGNLQVGWIDINDVTTLPVYLDSWYSVKDPETGMAIPNCILYTLPIHDGYKNGDNGTTQDILYITKPWNNDSIHMSTSDFLSVQAEVEGSKEAATVEFFTNHNYAKGFRVLENRESWKHGPPPGSLPIDITPKRGSLVMFDSVSVPHEVLNVEKNTRAALAGWFHEETQQFPDSFS